MTYLQWGIDVTNAVPITQLGPGAELQLLNQSREKVVRCCGQLLEFSNCDIDIQYSPYSENRLRQVV